MKISDMQSSGGAPLSGMYVSQDGCNLQPYTLSWEQPTIFRPLASPDMNGTGLLPMLETPETLSPWIADIEYFVRAAGQTRKVSFDCSLPEGETYSETPYGRLSRIANQLAKIPGNEWMERVYLKGAAGSGAALPKIRRVCAMQGIMYQHNGRDFSAQPKSNVLMILSPTASTSLGRILRNGVRQGSPEDIFSPLPSGHHKAFHFQRSGISLSVLPGWQVVTTSQPQQQQESGNQQFQSHVCSIVAMPPNVQIPNAQFNLTNWVPWNRVFRKLSASEQVKILASAFDPQLILKAFADSEFEPLLPDYILNMKTTTNMLHAPMIPPHMQSAQASGHYLPQGMQQAQVTQPPQSMYQNPRMMSPPMQAVPMPPMQPAQAPQPQYQPQAMPTPQQYQPQGMPMPAPTQYQPQGMPMPTPPQAFQPAAPQVDAEAPWTGNTQVNGAQPFNAAPSPMMPQAVPGAIDPAALAAAQSKLSALHALRPRTPAN